MFNILTVSKYEARILFRSWFFKIFSVLTLIFVFFFNLINQTSLHPNGDMFALPAVTPLTNLYIINVTQAIIAVFLASDFLKRDKALDTTGVIYIRSMTNTEYVIGKTLGNIWVFILLNLIALGMAAVFNLASPFNNFRLMPYFYYFLIISLPTLIFILGLSFFVMSVISNQAITFVLLLGYIAATLFYFEHVYYYLFDYTAFHLPLNYSDFVGFASLKNIMVHRSIYLFLGLGFIGLTITIFKRLPQSNIVRKTTFASSIIFLFLGFASAFIYIKKINNQDNHRSEMVALNNKYATMQVIKIKSCDIEIEHKGNEICAGAALEMVNDNKVPVSEIILTLNPGLEITQLSGAKFNRELQLIRITPDSPLRPGSTLKINISYMGTIDESFCYLDMDPYRLELLMNRGRGPFDSKHAGNKYAFVTPGYLLLTPETRWYPTAGISYSSNGLNWLATQFIDYSLKVKTHNGLKAISQGKTTTDGNGLFTFKPETKLTQISLAVGNYQTRKITVDNVDYSLNYLSGHNFFDKYFKILPDSIAPVIRDLRKTWEAKVQFVYPFKRLSLVEIPVQFYSLKHVWSGASEQVQPETVYLPEGGYKLKSANLPLSQKFAERLDQRGNQIISPREKEKSYFKRFVYETLLGNKINQFDVDGRMNIDVEETNPYFIFPNFYDFVTYIKSEKYPISNRVFESYLSKVATDGDKTFKGNLSPSEKGNIAMQEQSFAQIIGDQNDPEIAGNVIQTKSGFLFALMKGAVGADKFDEFIHKFIESRQFREVPVTELNDEMRKTFGLDLEQYLPIWYNSKTLPGYILSKFQAVKIKDEDKIKTMISFILTNTEGVPGAISVIFRLGGGRSGGEGGFSGGVFDENDNFIEKTISIGAKQSKKVSYLLNQDPRTMIVNTYASHNIPSTILQQLEKIEINEDIVGFEGEKLIGYTDGSEPSEIIMDNEDPGFKVEQPISQGFLGKIFVDPDKSKYNLKYKGINIWNPPVDWTLITNNQFYGKQIHSAYYLKSGRGNFKAVWNVPLKEGGYYKLSAFIPKIRFGLREDGKKNEQYNFTVFNDDGQEHKVVNLKDIDGGWVELGSYLFSSGTAKVELSNLSTARIVIADAVKLVKEY